ncbi:hypothetical protein CPB84DRAFT_1751510 [Gymnopilus junonius]|uniref:DUF5648 domain-containing protein n=1 Tax=Gymnopilus junonius TaxID=109634 RepID=A0A9P5NBB6_GYMJU|nr:hypothetical protein CPB84DRAFT_1751510 [Gymnopilus junonius]
MQILASLVTVVIFINILGVVGAVEGDSASKKSGCGKKGGSGSGGQGGNCANITAAVTYIQAFSPQIKAHTLDTRAAFVNADTTQGDWQFQGKVFRAWETQETSTVPLNRFLTQVNQDYIFTTASSVSGFGANGVVAYVYPSQICGSIPLLGASNSAAGDHYYTTDAHEHASLTSGGWSDAGISGYVLPLDDAVTEHGMEWRSYLVLFPV